MENIVKGFHYTDALTRPHPVEAKINNRHLTGKKTSFCGKLDFWVLDYSISDCGEVKVGELEWEARPPEIAHLYPPGTSYTERRYSGKFIGCHFLFTGETPSIRRLVNNHAGFARIVDHDRILLDAIFDGASAAALGNRGYWRFCTAFSKAMKLLESLSDPVGPQWCYSLQSNKKLKLSLPEKTLDYIEQHYRENLSIHSLAEQFRCSPSTLTHKFREFYHESIWERVMKIRIEQSVPLLHSGKTLKETAAETGFANEFYFSRIFKKITGVSPRRHKQMKSESIK